MLSLKVNFVDFWEDFDVENNFIINFLRERYDVEIVNNPDYLFFSVFGYKNLKYDCIKICYIGENVAPDFNCCDYAMSFDHITFGDRYLRLPLYQTYKDGGLFSNLEIISNHDIEKLLNRKFCSIVVSNQQLASPDRERFFKLLSEYKKVDSGGRMWNNVGGPVADKIQFISQYKFNIAFENSSVHGYTTEKIMEAMVADTCPIYWGNKLVNLDFNPDSFINVHDFNSLEDAVQYVVDLDSNDDEYIKMMSQPWLLDGTVFKWKDHFLDFMNNIVSKPLEEAKYLSSYGRQYIYREELLKYRTIIDDFHLRKLKGAFNKIRKILKK